MAVFRRKRSDGSLYETFTAEFQHRGLRVSEDTGTKSKSEATKWVTARRREIEAEAALRRSKQRPKSLNVGQALERYWDERLSLSLSATSEATWIKAWGEDIGADMPLEDLSTAVLVPIVTRRAKSGKAESSINRELHVIRAMHNWARDVWEYPNLRAIAWQRVRLKTPDTEIVPPTAEEVQRLYQCASGRLRAVILFAVLTGLRLHEIRNLKWENLSLDATPPKVTFTGKGRKTRTLPLSSAATSLLSSTPPGTSSRVFDMTGFRGEWTEARRLAGLPGTRFHDLRHAFATLFREVSKDPMALKDAMRHSAIDMSLIYAHADKSHLSPSLEAIGQKLSGLLASSTSSSNESAPPADAEPTEPSEDQS